MFWLVVLTLILIGLAFLLLEILVIPGAGVAGVIGFVLLGIGIWQAYDYYGSTTGHWILVGTIAGTVILLAISLRSRTWNKVMLKSAIGSRVNLIDELKLKPGNEGICVSRLAPMGKAIFGDEYYEVRTSGGYVDSGTAIIVEKIEDRKIFVKPKE